MTEITKEDAINHFEYGVSHDIFSEPVTTYAKMAIAALRGQDDHFREATKKVGHKWISVEERLPEDGVDVLTRRAVGMSVEAHCGWGWTEDGYHTKWSVTHWMPLPEPPEVEV
jgi:hypothetical protein